MMALYREIEDVQQLKKLNAELTRRISVMAPYRKRKVVGYPSGRDEFPVQFERKQGREVRWWSSRLSENHAAMINFVGAGDPDSEHYLMIDLQFNIPLQKFDRKHGGSFVEELVTGRVFLAHRGIVSRGKSRVPREILLQETTHAMVPVLTSSKPIQLFIVAPLDSPTLFDDIARFGDEIRIAARIAMGDEGSTTEVVPATLSSPTSSLIDQGLGRYFDEFEGVRKVGARRASKAFVQHGGIVRQLAEALRQFKLHKSKYVDLLAEGASDVCVYEVKTDCGTYSIYTAIGQLSLHAIACSKQFRKKSIRKVLVMPEGMLPEFKVMMLRDLGIFVLCFNKTASGVVEFDDLDAACPND